MSSGRHSRTLPYRVSDRERAAGSTLGGPQTTLVIKATGAIEKIHAIAAGKTVIGAVVLHHWDERTGIRLSARPGEFVIHPERQEHNFSLSNGISVHEEIFVLNGLPRGDKVDPPAAYYRVTLTNDTDEEIRIGTYAAAQLRGDTEHDVVTTFSPTHKALIAWNRSDDALVRLFGSSVSPRSFEVTQDSAKASATAFPGRLCDKALSDSSAPIGILHFSHRLKAGQSGSFDLRFSFSCAGRASAERAYRSCPPFAAALARTSAHFDEILGRALVITPDPEVNAGVQWAKANMLRTELLAPTGWCFVNDPTRSNNSVGRDTAWFAFGADYVTPNFARESLLWYATHLEKNGMVVEYYDIRNGKREDYRLNINDNTPLLILALWHHVNTTGDEAFLERVYPLALKAARYILSQRNERGLVWCTATGVSDLGIVGWRNVIKNYRLSGATTEVNSECYAALMTISHMARRLRKHAAAAEFKERADELRAAINRDLLNPDNGLYYLNIDLDGHPRTDVTSDLVFPVIFGVADEETAAKIIARLSVPEFWSEAGMHVVPRTDINYGPTHGYGLLGGIWVGVAFWYAFAAARFNPDFMSYALRASFLHFSKDTLRNNTVPGQFAEWLNGETLANQGMMLSPWFPPRYLWAAIEGAAGLDLSGASPSVNPRLPPHWKWLGVRNLPLAGGAVTWLVVRAPDLKMYANRRFEQSIPHEIFDADISEHVRAEDSEVCLVALRRADRITLFAGNTTDRTITTSVRLLLELAGSYTMRSFSSMRGAWSEVRDVLPKTVAAGFTVELDSKGFSIHELRQET